jgi:hypothetical protein
LSWENSATITTPMADSDMHAVTASATGFLLAVLWFDLMFDVQVLPHRRAELPPSAVASIAAYYRRVTSDARPMNRLVALVMLALVAAISVELARGASPRWAWWTSLALAVVPITLAATRTVPAAVRLGSQEDPPDMQADLARAICRDHLACLAFIGALLIVQLTAF